MIYLEWAQEQLIWDIIVLHGVNHGGMSWNNISC